MASAPLRKCLQRTRAGMSTSSQGVVARQSLHLLDLGEDLRVAVSQSVAAACASDVERMRLLCASKELRCRLSVMEVDSLTKLRSALASHPDCMPMHTVAKDSGGTSQKLQKPCFDSCIGVAAIKTLQTKTSDYHSECLRLLAVASLAP